VSQSKISARRPVRSGSHQQSGVNLVVLLALSDDGHPAYDANHAAAIATLAAPFACTPERLRSWAAEADIALIRGS
jgi:hypothetical protein